ncbi:MAG: TIGR01212 family radical SAM protein [Clostridia bacterium]|nr:TIGR01212 family radical SAM protein [Clostridia bacterium]
MLYNNLSGYFRKKYGSRLRKICIDGGFTCPNRDGKCGIGGCIFCGERGAGEHIDQTLSIRQQVEKGLSHLGEKGRAIAYFQSFTNTYAPVDVLRERYDTALIDERIVALAVGTRPDCINEEIADLLLEYSKRVDVWVELGLQSASDKTARMINRGYPTSVFSSAVEMLASRGIPVVAHMIIGLPGEGEAEVDQTVDLLNRSPIWGVKLHSLYVMEGTRLADMYRSGEFAPIDEGEYIALAARCIARLRGDIVIHRLTGDCPEGLLVAPSSSCTKNEIIDKINSRLRENGHRQGSLYNP